MITLQCDTAEAMENLAAALARMLSPGCKIYLQADLGVGKTTFARGFLHGLGHEGAVKSPTYTLVEPYEIAGQRIFHFDLYRLNSPAELESFGIRDYFSSSACWLVEWPEKAKSVLPEPDLHIQMHINPAGRELQIQGAATAMECVKQYRQEQHVAPEQG